MFNKKLKEEIAKLKKANESLWNKLNDYSWEQERKEKEIEYLNRVIEAQAVILKEFSEYIISLDKPKKKGKKNGK